MFAKLFARITESSLMEEDIPTRYVFMALLAIADPKGYVIGTDVALARRLNMSLPDFQAVIARLMAPDPESNSKEEEGRRIVPSDGERGYRLVNYLKYRNTRDEDARREYQRHYRANYRAEGRDKARPVNIGQLGQPQSTQAEAEAEAEQERGAVAPSPSALPGEVEQWNSHPELPAVRTVSKARLAKLRACRKDPFFATNWQAAIERIRQSRFCCGQNNRGWKADFDWFLEPDTVAKVMEGNYDNHAAAKPDPPRNMI